MRVLVPLGARFVTAFVVAAEADPGKEEGIKPVADVVDRGNLFSPHMLQLTKWMSDYYLADWADILKAALPPALDVKPERAVTLTAQGEISAVSHPILDILREHKTLPLKKLYEMFGYRGTYSQIRQLEEA